MLPAAAPNLYRKPQNQKIGMKAYVIFADMTCQKLSFMYMNIQRFYDCFMATYYIGVFYRLYVICFLLTHCKS